MIRIGNKRTRKIMASVLSAAMVLTNLFGTGGIAFAEEISDEAVIEEITEEVTETEPSEENEAEEGSDEYLQSFEISEDDQTVGVADTNYAEGFKVWFNTDGATSIKAGQYNDYPIYIGEDMSAKTNAITVDGTNYYSVQGSNNPKKDGNNPNGATPNQGSYIMVQAPADGLITVYGVETSGKPFYATKGDSAFISDSNTFCNELHSYMVSVSAKEEWYFYAQGSKAQFVGVTFELPKPEHDFNLSWNGEFGDSVVTFTNIRTNKAVEVTPADAKITLNEGYKYTVTTNSADYILNIDGKEESVLDLTDTGSLPNGFALTAVSAAKHAVAGSIMGLPEGASIVSVTFTDKSGAATPATVNNDGRTYSVNLKNGYYTTSAVVSGADGYTVYDHVLVEGLQGEEIANDVYFYAPAATYSSEYKAEITVGKNGDYVTISEALAAVKAMTRTAGQYVTLVLTDSEYVEQVIVDSENVKMVAAEGVDPIIRWYYGIGYKYFSIDSTGYYNIKNANDKCEMNYAQRWGAVVRVKSAGFIAEGINFINTFNIEVVDEELGDSKVGSSAEYGQGISGSIQERVAGLDVANGTNVERAAAVVLDAANAEFYKCSFISSQDTLYTGSSAAYFNDCYISGQTDYIFGNEGCSAVFDNCELNWLGYTAGSKAGYITATRGDYLFRGCNITKNESSDYTVTPGFFGRPWGNTPSVVFIGCTIEDGCMNSAGWYEMSGVKPEDVVFREFGNCTGSELSSDASTFFKSTYAAAEESVFALTLAEAEKLADPKNDSEYLGDWIPVNKITESLDLSAVAEWGEPGEEEEDPGEEGGEAEEKEYILDTTKDLTAFAAGAKTDLTEEKAGTDKYFTIIYSAKTKVDSSNKSWEDGYSGTQRINFGATTANNFNNSVKIKTSSPNAVVTIWWAAGDANRQVAVFDSKAAEVGRSSEQSTKNTAYKTTFKLEATGTYYIGNVVGNNYIFKISVLEGASDEKAPRAEWSTVAAPVIESAVQNEANIDVTVSALVDYDGADKVTVTMYDAKGDKVADKSSSAEKDSHVISFTPSASGTYTFKAEISRVTEGENPETLTKETAESKSADFILPLKAPAVNSLTNKGNGTVEVIWDASPEAVYYIITVDGEEYADTKTAGGTTIIIDGLNIGQKYTVGIKAARDDSDKSAVGVTGSVNVKAESERTWGFTAYGSSTDTKNNGYVGNINDGSVTVFSEGGKGKIVPNTSDGLAFYYTVMDPETENFTLEADVTVDKWTFSNGQEGFGLMVSDTIGAFGDSNTIWNNSIMAIASKVEYYYANGEVTTDTSAPKITMKLGIGTIARLGITAKDIADFKATASFVGKDGAAATAPANFKSETTTLETSCGVNGVGTYNIIGAYTANPGGTEGELVTKLHLSIQRNNTGYIVKYSDENGEVIGQKLIYDIDREELTRIDPDRIYVGFFASRNARITVENAVLTVIAPEDDAPAEERQIEYIVPNYAIESAEFSNGADYELVYYGNADGKLRITDSKNRVIADNIAIKAKTKYRFNETISGSQETYTVTVTPNPDYTPGPYKALSSYEPVTLTRTVTVDYIAGKYIYVSPDAKVSGDGSKASPMTVYEAVKIAQPGQTIVLAGGKYNLSQTLKIERGIDGREGAMISMIADPESTERPVFDFGSKCAGMIIAGDYWYFYGFDVTKSLNGQKGIQLSGNNNVLDGLRTYRNGNTGIQVSRYLTSDNKDEWPSNNLILNCTSYLNADAGYEDADGFAAKLTIGEGNVFDGCISAFNADDGWDLFAKAETGTIGKVVIKNCVAFRNGYFIKEDGTIVEAGNGNGFKMGGESLPGHHAIYNSVAFANKAKGIDSNSCPDIEAYNCTSFDNESYNVAFYTNNAINTAYAADGILSYKKNQSEVEQIKLKGTQNQSNVYGTTNYYCYGAGNSYNSANVKVADDWFVNLDTQAVLNKAVESMMDGTFGIYGSTETTGVVRRGDGSIKMNGYLELTDKVPAGVGARVNGASDSSAEFNVSEAGVSLMLNDDGNIGLKFTFSIDNRAVDTCKVGVYGHSGNKKDEVGNVAEIIGSNNVATQYAITVPMAAKEMNESVEFIVYFDEIIVSDITISPAVYAEHILNDNSGRYDEYKPVVKAMLNYGAEAQKYFEFATDDLVNKILSAEDKTLAAIASEDITKYEANSIASAVAGVDGVEYFGSSLILKDTVAIRHYFRLDSAKDIKFTIDGKACELNPVSGLYYIEIDNVDIYDIYSDITVACVNTASSQSAELKYSVMNYIAVAANGQNSKLKDVVKALYAYAKALSELN